MMGLGQKLVVAGLILLLIAAIAWFTYAVDDRDQKVNRPKSYSDTVSVILPSVQGAKTAAVKANDSERYEYWSNLEAELLGKVMQEKNK